MGACRNFGLKNNFSLPRKISTKLFNPLLIFPPVLVRLQCALPANGQCRIRRLVASTLSILSVLYRNHHSSYSAGCCGGGAANKTMLRHGVAGVLRRAISRHAASFTSAAPFPNAPNHRSILPLDGHVIRPFVQPNAFVAPSASIIGSVVVNDRAAVMYGAVVRGDLALIHVGAYTTIGENTTVVAGNVDGDMSPSVAAVTGLSIEPDVLIGDFSVIGPNCSLSSCTLQGRNIVGACSNIGPGTQIGQFSVLEPNSVVPPDTDIPPSELWGGNPAKKIRSISADESEPFDSNRRRDYKAIRQHMYEFLPFGMVYLEKERLAANS